MQSISSVPPGREVGPGLPDLGHRGRLVLPPLLLPVIPHLLSSEEVGHLVLAQVVIDIRGGDVTEHRPQVSLGSGQGLVKVLLLPPLLLLLPLLLLPLLLLLLLPLLLFLLKSKLLSLALEAPKGAGGSPIPLTLNEPLEGG